MTSTSEFSGANAIGREMCPIGVKIQQSDFDVGEEIAKLRSHSKRIGAVASFTGIMRDFNEGDAVTSLTLEHYPGMTEASIAGTCEHACARWPLMGVSVVHRIGTLAPQDHIVFVGVASAHRQAAFQACEFIMDFLKTQAPLWKKEVTADGERWIDERQSDIDAKQRW